MVSSNPPSHPITARYDITIYDYADWLEYRGKPNRKPNTVVLLKQIVIALGFAALLSIALRYPKNGGNPCPMWLIIVLGVIAFGGTLYSQFRSATANHRREALRAAEAQDPATLHDITLTITKTDITVQREIGTQRLTWSQVEKISLSPEHHIFIDLSDRDSLIVPNSAFESKSVAQSFHDHAIEYWRNAHGKTLRLI